MNADNFDAMIIPGGFGAAKNLSNWATDGVNCTVNKEVENAIKMFEKSKKPMGLVYTYFRWFMIDWVSNFQDKCYKYGN